MLHKMLIKSMYTMNFIVKIAYLFYIIFFKAAMHVHFKTKKGDSNSKEKNQHKRILAKQSKRSRVNTVRIAMI